MSSSSPAVSTPRSSSPVSRSTSSSALTSSSSSIARSRRRDPRRLFRLLGGGGRGFERHWLLGLQHCSGQEVGSAIDAVDRLVLAEVVEAGRALGASALGAPFGLHHEGLVSSRMSLVAGPNNPGARRSAARLAIGICPCQSAGLGEGHRIGERRRQGAGNRRRRSGGQRQGNDRPGARQPLRPAAHGYRAALPCGCIAIVALGRRSGQRVRGVEGVRPAVVRSGRRGIEKRAGVEDRLDDLGLSLRPHGAAASGSRISRAGRAERCSTGATSARLSRPTRT